MVDELVLKQLGSLSTPTISNAIERLRLRRCDVGYTCHPVRCLCHPGHAVVGHAVTALIRTSEGTDDQRRVHPLEWWDLIRQVPEPRIIVMHDADYPHSQGSFWGEVQGNIHRRLGCVGIITDGFIRDVSEMTQLGLLVLATGVTVSRCYPRLLTIGEPVSVMGATVETGQLVHADGHGLAVIPEGEAARIVAEAHSIEGEEQAFISVVGAPTWSFEKMKEAYGKLRR